MNMTLILDSMEMESIERKEEQMKRTRLKEEKEDNTKKEEKDSVFTGIGDSVSWVNIVPFYMKILHTVFSKTDLIGRKFADISMMTCSMPTAMTIFYISARTHGIRSKQ